MNQLMKPKREVGIAGYGASVHDALRNLADMLVESGVWIEVTDSNHPWRDVQFKRNE